MCMCTSSKNINEKLVLMQKDIKRKIQSMGVTEKFHYNFQQDVWKKFD